MEHNQGLVLYPGNLGFQLQERRVKDHVDLCLGCGEHPIDFVKWSVHLVPERRGGMVVGCAYSCAGPLKPGRDLAAVIVPLAQNQIRKIARWAEVDRVFGFCLQLTVFKTVISKGRGHANAAIFCDVRSKVCVTFNLMAKDTPAVAGCDL